MKGCFVYFCDKALEQYFMSLLDDVKDVVDDEIRIEDEVNDDVKYVDYLPLYSIKAACGYFGDGDDVGELGWVRVDGFGRLNRNMYIIQAVGDSMEPLISDGDYCVFRNNIIGSRNEKIVLVQHHGHYDADNGGRYSIKKYTSKKSYDEFGNWMHEEILLKPINKSYNPIVISEEDSNEFCVIGEFVGVI